MPSAKRVSRAASKASSPSKFGQHQLLISRFFAPKPDVPAQNNGVASGATNGGKDLIIGKVKADSRFNVTESARDKKLKDVGQNDGQVQTLSQNALAQSAAENEDAHDDGKGDHKPSHLGEQKRIPDSHGPGRSNHDLKVRAEVEELGAGPNHSPGENVEGGCMRRVAKRRRHVVKFDEDIDSEPEMERLTKAPKLGEDPDFDADKEMEEEEPEDRDLHGISEEENEEEAEGISTEKGTCEEEDVKKRRCRGESVTLMSYSRENIMKGFALPRDAKRRKRFTQKIGRLERNSFFIRCTGGGEQVAKDAKREVSKVIKYTPLETQYLALRKQNRDMLLVIECGYKYRMFDEDASVASKVLRIAAYFDHNFLTASFPTHRLAHHIGRLVHAGYKVGVISQNETAALKKASDKASKLFERKLTAVYTKGTFMADGKLNALMFGAGGKSTANAPTYIMAILEVHREDGGGDDEHKSQLQKIALAAVDSATGEVLFDLLEDDVLRSNLESRLVALEPVEILTTNGPTSSETELVISSFSDNMSVRLERLKSSFFRPNSVLSKLNETVEARFSDSKSNADPVLACLGALADYLSQFGLQLSMSNATEFKSFSSRRHMTLGADVLRNFEVFGNSNNGGIQGSLIGLVNRTMTAFGNRQIRQWLSHPLIKRADISERLDAVEYLRDIVDNRESAFGEDQVLMKAVSALVKCLSGLPDLEKGLTRIFCRKCTPSEFLSVICAFEGVGAGLDHIRTLSDKGKLPFLLNKMFSNTPFVGETLSGSILRILNRAAAQNNAHHSLFSQDIPLDELLPRPEFDGFLELVSQLHRTNEQVRHAEISMDVLLAKLKKKHSFPTWEWKKVAVEEYLLEVPTARASSLPHSWPIICQTKTVKRFRPPEAAKGFDEILCSRETRDAISTKCWMAYLELFTFVAAQLRAVVRTLTDLDCLCALAHVSNLPGYTKPEIECDTNTHAGLRALRARHPLTETLQSSCSYVPNDIHLGLGKHEIALVISGPNYGGKSSYTRMTALVAILAQLGSYVPAESAALSPFDSVYARMGSSDSIAKGMSSLMVELAETSRILSNASSRSLVVLDELGRGTSTHDGTAIAHATLGHLVRMTRCVTMCVTHFPVLSSLGKELPELVSAHYMDYVEEKEDGNTAQNQSDAGIEGGFGRSGTKITFLYKLTKGVAASSYGLNVARLAGIPSGVITHAAEKASALEMQLDKQSGKQAFVRLLCDNHWKDEGRLAEIVKITKTIKQPAKTAGWGKCKTREW